MENKNELIKRKVRQIKGDMWDRVSDTSNPNNPQGAPLVAVEELCDVLLLMLNENPVVANNTCHCIDKTEKVFDKVKEKMYSMASTFFLISETLVNESKRHISSEEAIEKIRELMQMNNIPCSCFAVDKMLEEIRGTL